MLMCMGLYHPSHVQNYYVLVANFQLNDVKLWDFQHPDKLDPYSRF